MGKCCSEGGEERHLDFKLTSLRRRNSSKALGWRCSLWDIWEETFQKIEIKQCQCPDACMYTSVWSISGSSGLNPDENIGWGKNSSFSHEWNRSHCKAEWRTMIPSSHHGSKEYKSHFSWCVLRMGPAYVSLHPCWVTKIWIGKKFPGMQNTYYGHVFKDTWPSVSNRTINSMPLII